MHFISKLHVVVKCLMSVNLRSLYDMTVFQTTAIFHMEARLSFSSNVTIERIMSRYITFGAFMAATRPYFVSKPVDNTDRIVVRQERYHENGYAVIVHSFEIECDS